MVINRTTVFDYVYRQIKAQDANISISAVPSNTPSSFPAVAMQEISAVEKESNVTFNNDDKQYISTFEVNVYTNKEGTGYTQGQALMDSIQSYFKALGYIMVMREPLANLDTTIYRFVARFRRTIGGGDTISN